MATTNGKKVLIEVKEPSERGYAILWDISSWEPCRNCKWKIVVLKDLC
jgi:hypothetical protein